MFALRRLAQLAVDYVERAFPMPSIARNIADHVVSKMLLASCCQEIEHYGSLPKQVCKIDMEQSLSPSMKIASA